MGRRDADVNGRVQKLERDVVAADAVLRGLDGHVKPCSSES